jgi:hypothetical protein
LLGRHFGTMSTFTAAPVVTLIFIQAH